MKKVCGVGTNDADYRIGREVGGKRIWRCPFYARWLHMLNRCYGAKYQAERPSYLGCFVCDEWLVFSAFKAWMETQDWQGMHLDKDLLVFGNKVYSPETCVFITPRVNSFLLDGGASSKGLSPGATYHRATDRYRAYGWSAQQRKRVMIGAYKTADESRSAWLAHKREQAIHLASIQSDQRIASAILSRYTNNG